MSPLDEDRLLEGMRLDERAGPARRITRDQAALFVEDALNAWEREQPLVRRRSALLPAFAAAAALLLAVVGGASAARWYFGKAEQPKPASAPLVPAKTKRAHATVLAPITFEAEREDPELVEPARVRRPVAHEPALQDKEPDDLLQRANQLRAEGRFQTAADTYAQVYERYPRSLSAYAAQIAAASIALEHLSKPQHARSLFESALRGHPKGALDLEARQGLVLSLRDLGRDRDEAQALRGLIRAHGETPAARRAEARLKELTGSTP